MANTMVPCRNPHVCRVKEHQAGTAAAKYCEMLTRAGNRAQGQRNAPPDGGQNPQGDHPPMPPAGTAFQKVIDQVISSRAVASAERSDDLDVITYTDGTSLHIAKKENDPDDPDDDTVVLTLYGGTEDGEPMTWEDTPDNVAAFVQEITALKEESVENDRGIVKMMAAELAWKGYQRIRRKRKHRRKAKRRARKAKRKADKKRREAEWRQFNPGMKWLRKMLGFLTPGRSG